MDNHHSRLRHCRLQDNRPSRLTVVDRRDLLTTAASAATLLALFSAGARAQDKPAATEFDAAFKKITGDAKPIEGKLNFDVPEIAESGNTVAYSLSIESPMTEQDHVKKIHILSTGNPQPGIASFNLTPQSGKAFASGRMRLAKTQDVVALAELSDGKVLVSKRTIKVTIGGCGG